MSKEDNKKEWNSYMPNIQGGTTVSLPAGYTYTAPISGKYNFSSAGPTNSLIDDTWYTKYLEQREKRIKEAKEEIDKFEELTKSILKICRNEKMDQYSLSYMTDGEDVRMATLGKKIDEEVKRHLFNNKLDNIINVEDN